MVNETKNVSLCYYLKWKKIPIRRNKNNFETILERMDVRWGGGSELNPYLS